MINKINEWQNKIGKLSGSKTFCILPWMHFATRPNGDMRLCCNSNSSGAGTDHEIGLVKNESGRPANFKTETPLSAWNNEYMRSVRTTMLQGNIPASCSKCYEEESKGVVSKRLWETGEWVESGISINQLVNKTEKDGTIPNELVYLDLRLGHTCNLKCIMCSPHDSSQWVSDQKKLMKKVTNSSVIKQMTWDRKTFDNFWHENPKFWEEIYEQIPNLKQVYFAGGEPLMIKEHKLFLEEIIRKGYHNNILIRYNTNGLKLDEDIINLWKQFKKVKIGFSIDAIENRNYYIRYPSDWNTIINNLERLDNTPSNIHVSIATAIQILNIKHLPDLAKWKIKQNYKKINFTNTIGGIEAGGGIINMHLLYIPTFLSIQVLPQIDKIDVSERFKELKSWLYENYRKDDDYWLKNPYGWKRWNAVLEHMNSKDMSMEIPGLQEYIKEMDIIRNINIKNYIPELSHLF